MSDSNLSRRLERLFADVTKEEASPKTPAPREAGHAETPQPGLVGAPDELVSAAAKSINSTSRAAAQPGPSGAAERGVISSAFQQDEKTWATLRLVDESASHSWSDQEQMLVKQVADQLSLALESARLFQETKNTEEALQHQNERLAAAAEIGRLVTSSLDIDTIFGRTVTMVSERFGFYHAALFLIDDSGNRLALREATGEAGAKLKSAGYGLPVNASSIVGRVALTGELAVVNNTSADRMHVPNPLLPGTRAECAIPLRVGNRIIGALDIQATAVDAFARDDMSVLQILGDQVAIAIDNARSYELAQQAVKEMRELDRVKTQFLANMSHELRTPLNSIIGFSRVILKGIDGPISDVQRQDITAIYSSGQHLLGLINDVLDLAKIEAGKMDISLEETSLPEMISSVMSTASGLVQDKPIRLTQRVPEDLPSVRADPIRVRQVLLNLLSNAAKFTDQGEIIVEASVESRVDGTQQVRVSVSDTGSGISAEDQKKLFQAFSQVDDSPTRKTGGSGLGLSISQELVQLQGGRIGVESAPGKGSTFFFTLPIYRAGAERTAEGDRKLVLAVDDDPQVLKLYERSLGAQGYQVVGLTDPTRAREMALQVKPFAITLDIMMPGYDGWQVLAELKRDADTRTIPVIVCSILEQQERGLRLGAADYVLKPILGDGLLNALDRLREDRRVREVLIVDDDADSLRLLEKSLENQAGCKVVLAQGGAEGWKQMADHAPDAVVLDLLMPDMDGFVLIEKMRERPELRQVPVIVVADAEITSDQRAKLTELGQRAIMKGTGNEQELVQAVNQALHPARANRRKMALAVKCLDCGNVAPYHPTSTNCPRCNSQWREAEYAYEELAPAFPRQISNRPFDMWRYRELLPVRHSTSSLTLGEGGTPLLQAANLGMMLGTPHLFIKDERQGPTGSFKDRQAALTIAALKEAGITEMVAASTGNVAISYSAYAARAGVKLWAFVTSLVPEVKMREIALYGSQVVKVTGSYDQAKQVASEFARQRNLFQDLGARTISSVEAMKTIAFEIAEQLADVLGTEAHGRGPAPVWRAPDWYVQPISGGMGPLGVVKGYRELKRMGLVGRIPSLALIQADGCAPMVRSFREGLQTAVVVETPRTRIETLATGDPGRAYTLLRQQVLETGGAFESVTDEEAFRAMHILAKMEGLSIEPAAAVGFAGLFKLVRTGVIKPGELVVVNCTGHTMPAEETLLGPHWTRDVEFPAEGLDTPEEGLLAALNQVAPNRFPRVAIVDDNAEARQLIRRILQAQGNYSILEADNGKDGYELSRREVPDLVILDLMMPGMDGFQVLEALKADKTTAHIPVIVATAKELTADEKTRLGTQIQALMQKGDFLNDEFVEEVKSLLK